ncbi:MAG: YfiR family protein [Pseudohongiella sp.]|nr:YfiR family protein [Pseudohongiella sp.]MDO9518763.1 YfiR family protein [Pseudohongiella sp.]MDP2126415.1 YfiR family protein [Pseudohongiella sp.]
MKFTSMHYSVRSLVLVGLMSVFTLNSAHAQRGQLSGSSGGSDAIARFVMNFGRFIDWPESAFPAAGSDLKVCILGENQLGRSMDQIVNGKKAGDRSMAVSTLAGTDLAGAKTCHIVFVSASETARAAEVTAALQGSPVLTVSEIVNFGGNGGMISLSGERGDAVAIRMNRGLIDGAGLNVREQLMRAIQQ